jgi:UDP-2,3-diacylglucosamine pyrophosphatase LpxH
MPIRARFRSVFVSDLHLGARGARARDAARFLRRIDCEYLYLVGDIIDMGRLRQRWHWPVANNKVVNRVLKLARRGTRVVYIPGNHDEAARRYAGLSLGGVEIAREASHRTADGRSILVTHGDQFDLVVRHAPLLSAVGSWAYDWLVLLNHGYNWGRRLVGLDYWSLSHFLKLKVKSACTYLSRFEDLVIQAARRSGHHGVICGHVHKAEIREGDGSKDAIGYFNCGDWVESCSALVERPDGRLELIDGMSLTAAIDAKRAEAGRRPMGSRIPPDAGREVQEEHLMPACEAAATGEGGPPDEPWQG